MATETRVCLILLSYYSSSAELSGATGDGRDGKIDGEIDVFIYIIRGDKAAG